VSQNTFSDISRRGIRVSCDSRVQVTDDNIFRNIGGANIEQEPFDEGAYEKATKDAFAIPARIRQAITDNKCTFTVTETDFVVQRIFRCFTCELHDNQGVCEVCAIACHRGHDLEEDSGAKRFYCDCPGAGHCKACS
jgi:hypothetical protein